MLKSIKSAYDNIPYPLLKSFVGALVVLALFVGVCAAAISIIALINYVFADVTPIVLILLIIFGFIWKIVHDEQKTKDGDEYECW